MRYALSVLVCTLAVSTVEASTRTVCASGCQFSNLQGAIDAAVPGDVILLRAGQTFTGNVVLRNKHTSSTSFITIRTDASAGVLPGDGVRLVPAGKAGANVALSSLPRLVGNGGTYKSTPVIRTEPGAHHYRLQFLDIDGSANVGYETLVQLGENTSNQTSIAASPYALVLDRVYLHGHPVLGMKRGVAVDGRSIDVINSYISDFKSLADAQGIAGVNGVGPIRIVNNYIEAAGENIMFGGSDPKTSNLVPSDIEIRNNHVIKPLAWMNAILSTPSRVTMTAGSGGSLAAGTHYFEVVAVMSTGGATVVSAPSTEMAVSVSSGGSVSLSWSGVSGAQSYRVYRGTSSGGESRYQSTTSTSISYTGSSESSGTPAKSGSRWTAKNLIEFKNGQRATIDGNVLENNWAGFQQGQAIVLTPRNQENTAPWSTVRDITLTNNTVHHVAAGVTILGYDDIHPSQQAKNITLRNNLFFDVGGSLTNGRFLTITGGPANVTLDHNTILNDATVVIVAGPQVPGFVYTNNLSRHNTYGIQGQNRAPGLDTLNAYFPGWVFTDNVLAGGKASSYPPGNFFPTVSEFEASFVDAAAGDYSLVATSPFNNAGTDGKDIGVSMAAIDAAQDVTLAGTGSSSGGGGTSDPGASLPTGWQSQDIGATGDPGSASYASGVFAVSGSGADIWGTADAFQFAYTTLDGDGTIVGRVATVSGSESWTKVGVMIRGGLAPDAAHASMFVSTAKGLAFQRRTSAGGLSTSTSGGAGVAPMWVRLSRAGNVVTASVSRDGVTWTKVGSDTIALPSTALVGIAVNSHTVSTLATGTVDHVSVAAGHPLPSGWESTDIGAVGLTGSASTSGSTFTVKGAGADVWGNADALQFGWHTLDADGDIVARVATVSGSEAWTKAGVMMRMTLDPSSPQAFMLVSVGKGFAFQRRTVSGGTTVSTSGGTGTAPRWVKLSRRGSQITAYISKDGVTWTVVGSDGFSISGPLHVGLAVSSHDPSALATATFDNVR